MAGRTHKLLVVDDEFLNRDMLKQRLLRSGFEVAEAEDAQEALGVIEQGGIDLVLLDTMMPGMSGIDLLKLLRGVHGPSELPVIMATAVTDSESIAGALALGANDYVSKPIDYPVALARISSQLIRREADRRLRESEERYALASRGADDGIWDWDLRSNRVYYSPRWRAVAWSSNGIGDSPEEWLERVHPDDREELRARLERHWADGAAGDRPFFAEYRLRHNDGCYHWMRGRGHTVRDAAGRPVRMTGAQTDITEQKVHDGLTGLANRLLFLENAGRSLEQSVADPSWRFAILFLDIDRFKLVNDTMGHVAGDRFLVGVAGRLKEALGEGRAGIAGWDDVVARFGGDEFAILLRGIRDCSQAEGAAERLLRAFDQPIQLDGREVFCSMSIGIATSNATYCSVEDLLRDADTAMYGAKAQGGARYLVFDEAMRRRAEARLEIETGLRTAVERNELRLHYQPKVDLRTQVLVGFEALVRWMHPRLGLVPPAEFIEVAEDTGQIHSIGEWVLREACSQMVKWRERYGSIPPLGIAVNLSARQFRNTDIPGLVAGLLEEMKLPASCLQLEITESAVMDDPQVAIATTQKLRELGVGIDLDDFGTGYSSLTYLCRMPINTLKIDRSFIGRMNHSRTDLEVVRTVLTLARSLEMRVVAEGVERADQVTRLVSMGCQFGQGYYFGKPVPAEEAEPVLEAWIGANARP